MKIKEVRKFEHQLGIAIIRIYNNGTATWKRKRYSSYASARRAAANYYGFMTRIK